MTQAHVVQIPNPGPDKVPLSKAQKEFNRLTRKIGELEVELGSFRTAATGIQQRIQAEYVPLLRDYNEQQANLVRVFDRAHDRPETTKTERKKLVDLIVNLAYDLISEHGMDELKSIFDKYDTNGFDATDAEADEQVSEVMKEMMTSMYGIKFDENADISTKEKFMAYVDEQLKARQENSQSQQANDGDWTNQGHDPHGNAGQSSAKKAKSAKQQAREAKQQVEERNITKAVRTLYMDLVKTFHPDREPDDAEKARKTSIMQRVTEAYEKSDLMALFRLQLEYNRIDQTHLEKLAEDQLKYYNKILKQQADELGQELYAIQIQFAAMLDKPMSLVGSAPGLEFSFNNDIRALKKSIKEVKREVKTLSDPAYLKGWLRTYKIQKPGDFDSFDSFFV